MIYTVKVVVAIGTGKLSAAPQLSRLRTQALQKKWMNLIDHRFKSDVVDFDHSSISNPVSRISP
jgi:hypothetical protein